MRNLKNLRFDCCRCKNFSTASYQNDISSGTGRIFLDKNKKRFIETLSETKKSFASILEQRRRIKNSAGVLIPLCEVNNQACLLFTQRSHGLRRNKGQVSFPGGMADDSDKSIIHTALRETEEEIGVNHRKVEIWATTPPLPDQAPIDRQLNNYLTFACAVVYQSYTMNVFGVVGYVGKINVDELIPNVEEVSSVFTVPISTLSNSENIRSTRFRVKASKMSKWDYVTPVYMTHPRIWGLTATFVDLTLAHLLPNYNLISNSFALRAKATSAMSRSDK